MMPSPHADHNALMQTVAAGPPRASVQAARTLAEIDSPDVLALMLDLLAHPNPLLGQVAVEYIKTRPGAGASLLARYDQASYMVKVSIVQALGQLREAAALDLLLGLIAIEPSAERVGLLPLTAASALGTLADARAIAPLERLLNAHDGHMRQHAAVALQAIRLAAG